MIIQLTPARTRAILCALLVALTLVAYVPIFGNSFINYDDPVYITNNAHVQQGLSWATVKWAFTTQRAANWHPLTWLSLALDCQLYGLNPAGYHAASLALHALNTVLLFLIFARMTRAHAPSALLAALFAVHPLHVESVAWAAERKDVLSALFGLLAIAAYVRYTAAKSLTAYLGVALCLALSLMAKPMLVTLPLLLLLLDYWPLGRRPDIPYWKLLWEKAPFAALAAASCAVTFFAQRHGHAVRSLAAVPLTWRIENGLVSYWAYLGKTIWPAHLAVFYPYPGKALSPLEAACAAFGLVAVTVAAIRARRRCPYLYVGWLWYLIALIPVLGIVQVGEQAMADRYTYIPLIGVFIGVSWAANALLTRAGPARPYVAAFAEGSLIAILTALTSRQVQFWRNSETLFSHALAVTQHNYLAHSNLASALLTDGRYAQAEPQCRAALAIKPDYTDALINLGIALGGQGQFPRAIAVLTKAAREAPDRSDVHYNLGLALAAAGDTAKAEAHFRRALSLDPSDQQSRAALARIARQSR